MSAQDVIIGKAQSIQRCVRRAREEYARDPGSFETNYSQQDAAVLNVLRACEQSIDLANYVVKALKIGVPASSAESFELLFRKQIIDKALVEQMAKMTSFRNVIIHEYQKTDIKILRAVLEKGLDDLVRFTEIVLTMSSGM